MDEVVVIIAGKWVWLRRAVDSEGEVLNLLVQARRNTAAAVRLTCPPDVDPALARVFGSVDPLP